MNSTDSEQLIQRTGVYRHMHVPEPVHIIIVLFQLKIVYIQDGTVP